MLLFTAFSSCNPNEYEFNFNGKWVLLTSKFKGKEIRNEIIHSPLLSFTIRDKKFYPAIQFNAFDSTVIIPGKETKKEKLLFSVDKNLENIKFLKMENPEKTPLIDGMFLKNFKIEKDIRLGGLKLTSDSTIIYMMPAERFARQINSRHMD